MLKNGIIPSHVTFFNKENFTLVHDHDYLSTKDDLDLESICVFAALGFFLDQDTHFKNIKAIPPSTTYTITNDQIKFHEKYFSWVYNPRDISLNQATEEFTALFESTVNNLTQNKNVILPLSGGLDSRTLALALSKHPSVKSYSYEFENGISEINYARQVAHAVNMDFYPYYIKSSYLWNVIENLGRINNCTSEFTHPRQMAVIDQVEKLGNCFVLGHWGDVLFDGMGVPENMSNDDIITKLYHKVVKKGGLELANALWNEWGLSGNFESYLKNRIGKLLESIHINHAGAKIRAFKSLYWAPRWTSSNLSIFARKNEIVLPYYHDDMCRFICEIPESWLDQRQIQIEYLKKNGPALARIKWQQWSMNLYNFQNYYKWYNLPARACKRVISSINPPKNQRNWELQFVGDENQKNLFSYLYNNEFNHFISKPLVEQFYSLFKQTGPGYSHSVSTLLTLSLFNKLHHR